MKARQVIETAQWEPLPLSSAPVRDGGAPAYDGSAAYVLAAGLSAAKLGDMTAASRAVDILNAMRKQAEAGSNAYRSKPFGIMALEVAAVIHASPDGRNDREGAERFLKEATALELALDAPSGPPEPLKPAFELYGELLLDQGRQKEAAAQFEQSLIRMPNRRASVRGLERAMSAGTKDR
jgi:hypothetical protein